MATVADLRPADVEDIKKYVAAEIAERDGTPPNLAAFDYLDWYLFQNPSNPEGFAGWGIRDDTGALVGVHMCNWQKLAARGGTVPICFSNGYYVKKEFRGPLSAVLFLKFIECGKRAVLGGTTTNLFSGAVWKASKHSKICPGGDREVLLPLRLGGLIGEALARKKAPAWISRAAAHLPAPLRWLWRQKWTGELSKIGSASALAALLPSGEPPVPDMWIRDENWLHWRLFHPILAGKTQVWHYRDGDRTVTAAVHFTERGAGKVRMATLIKLWLDRESVSVLAAFLSALAARLCGEIDVIATRFAHTDLVKEQMGRWAILRPLPNPAGWQADAAGLLMGEPLYLVPGDGDSALGF